MAREDDDILLGDPIILTAGDRDSDGDGVGDMQERLDGTDPGDASDRLRPDPTIIPDATGDPRGDLERATLERETAFDPTAVMPEGMSIKSGLEGLMNIDGSDLSTGSNHFGVGEEAILDGRLDANSPLRMSRDPLEAAKSTADSTGHGTAPPAGADISSRAPNWDLVSGKGADDLTLTFGEPKRVTDDLTLTFGEPKRVPTPPPEPPPPPPPKTSTDPDADPGQSGGISTGEELSRVLSVRGGDTDFVEGYGGGPQIEGDQPPVRFIDFVTDGGDGSVDTSTPTEQPDGVPDAPVIHTINPDAGIVLPPTGDQPPGGSTDGGGDLGLTGISSAATAVSASETSAPGIWPAGFGGGAGIGSLAPVDEEPTFVAGVRSPPVASFVSHPPMDTGHGDSDGDGVSDTQEILDDNALSAGSNHFGVGEEAIPDDPNSYLGAPFQDEKMTLGSTASAATAVPADDISAQGISIVGSDGASGLRITIPVTDDGIDVFANDLAGGLVVDLGVDPAPVRDDFESIGADFLLVESPVEFADVYQDDILDG